MLECKFVITVGKNNEQLSSAGSATEILDDVQGRLVGPMQVLQNNDCWASPLKFLE